MTGRCQSTHRQVGDPTDLRNTQQFLAAKRIYLYAGLAHIFGVKAKAEVTAKRHYDLLAERERAL